MLEGVSKEPVPYVPESERATKENQTVIWIRPKSGQDANRTMARYAGAQREGRKGYRDINASKLDSADIQEFTSIVSKVENYKFSDQFADLRAVGMHAEITDVELLKKVASDISADVLIEIMEASNNMSMLKAGEKKSSSSRPTSASGGEKKGSA